MGVAGPPLGVYVGDLQVLWGLLHRLWGCMLATYRGLLDSLWGCMLSTYRSYWGAFGAVCWQPTGFMGVAGLALGLYVATHEAYQGLLDRLWLYVGNLQVFLGVAAYRSYRGCWTAFGAEYVGNLQVLWGWLIDFNNIFILLNNTPCIYSMLHVCAYHRNHEVTERI